jgi:hypothetical protein
VENGDEEMDVEEQISEDGVSGEEIAFTNSFEALHSAPAVQLQLRKKTKTNNTAQMVWLVNFAG